MSGRPIVCRGASNTVVIKSDFLQEGRENLLPRVRHQISIGWPILQSVYLIDDEIQMGGIQTATEVQCVVGILKKSNFVTM